MLIRKKNIFLSLNKLMPTRVESEFGIDIIDQDNGDNAESDSNG